MATTKNRRMKMFDTAVTLFLSIAGGAISGGSLYRKSYIGIACGAFVCAVAIYRAISL